MTPHGRAGKDALGLSLQMVPVPFSCPGAEFTQSLEVTFYPGGETVQVTQTAEGLGPDNYLSLRTHIQGEVPFLPENVTVHITPYEELYSYSSSGKTHLSSSHTIPEYPTTLRQIDADTIFPTPHGVLHTARQP